MAHDGTTIRMTLSLPNPKGPGQIDHRERMIFLFGWTQEDAEDAYDQLISIADPVFLRELVEASRES